MTAMRLWVSALAVKGRVAAFPQLRRRPFPLQVRAGSEDDSNSSSLKLKEEDDARYVLKLGLGSVAGAAVIKYGSVLVPQVTAPNLPEALFIITTPVIAFAAVLILLSVTKTETSPSP